MKHSQRKVFTGIKNDISATRHLAYLNSYKLLSNHTFNTLERATAIVSLNIIPQLHLIEQILTEQESISDLLRKSIDNNQPYI